MEKLGTSRRSFSLTRRPPCLYSTTFHANKGVVEVFEPYEENLPLEAGFYTFVIDDQGRFRVKRGNTSSHANFTRCSPVGGAGHFQINRAGNVSEVFCISLDYRILVPDHVHPTVGFIIDSFCNHHALEISPLAVFRFKQGTYGTFFVSIDKSPILDLGDRLERLAHEGQGSESVPEFTDDEREAYAHYIPEPPVRLYAMRRDQLIIDLESEQSDDFEYGPSEPPYSPERPRMTSGKKAFVIDRQGWLIVGYGHHTLSGGGSVGAAGQVVVEPSGMIGQINLNFSGHYRPDLDANYARYTFRALASHPLLTLSPACVITGR